MPECGLDIEDFDHMWELGESPTSVAMGDGDCEPNGGDGEDAFSFDAAVNSYGFMNTPQTASLPVLLAGINFGSIDVTASVKLSQAVCLSVTWTATTILQCESWVRPRVQSPWTWVTVSLVVGTGKDAFSFDTPVVSHATRNIPRTAGAVVPIHGFNLGQTDHSLLSARLSAAVCNTVSWASDTTLRCMTADRYYGVSGIVLMRSIAGTVFDAFTYDAPVVSYAFGNSPHSGSTKVTLDGFSFDPLDLSVTAALDTALCLQSSWASLTTLSCVSVPNGAHLGNAFVTVETVVGTDDACFSFDAPTVSYALGNSPQTGGRIVSIRGHNFGMTDFTPSGRLGLGGCSTISWTTDTGLQCSTAASEAGLLSELGNRLAGDSRFTVSDFTGTGREAFTFDAVIVSHGFKNSPLTGGASLTITGLNFAAQDCTASTKMHMHFNTASWISDTSMTYMLGTKAHTWTENGRPPAHWWRTEAEYTGTGPSSKSLYGLKVFSYDAPLSSAFSQNLPISGSYSATLHGMNFGSYEFTPSALLDGKACITASWNTPTSLRCKTDYATFPQERPLVMRVGRIHGTAIGSLFSYDSPVSSLMAVFNMVRCGSGSVTLRGMNFGIHDFSPSQSLLYYVPRTTAWVSATSIRASADSPLLASPSSLFHLTVASTIGTSKLSFSFDTPVLTTHTLMVNTGTSLEGLSITVNGLNFGSGIDFTPSATVPLMQCMTTSWTSSTAVACGSSQTLLLPSALLAVADVYGTLTSVFSFDAPVVSGRTEPWSDYRCIRAKCPRAGYNVVPSGGSLITIEGLNFGSWDVTSSVRLDTTPCLSSSWLSSTSVQCSIFAQSKKTYPLMFNDLNPFITIADLTGTGEQGLHFSFDSPTISTASALNAHAVRLTSITIFGINFGQINRSPSVALNGHWTHPNGKRTFMPAVCQTASWATSTSITCHTVYSYGSQARATVTIDDIIGTHDRTFRFEGCGCSLFGMTSARCDSNGVCNCKNNYTGEKCAQCDEGFIKDPSPYCKSGDCRMENWVTWSECVEHRKLDNSPLGTCLAREQNRLRRVAFPPQQGGKSCPTSYEERECGVSDCVTHSPTPAPTPAPTPSPTSTPTPSPTPGPTSTPTPSPTPGATYMIQNFLTKINCRKFRATQSHRSY